MYLFSAFIHLIILSDHSKCSQLVNIHLINMADVLVVILITSIALLQVKIHRTHFQRIFTRRQRFMFLIIQADNMCMYTVYVYTIQYIYMYVLVCVGNIFSI